MDVTIQNYWFLPVGQQAQIRTDVYAPVLMGGGHVYRVRGRISVIEYCECEYCQGHSTGNSVIVDEMVTGADEQDAVENTIRQCSTVGDMDEWIESPVVTKLID